MSCFTAGPMLALCGSNDVTPHKEVIFGVRTVGDVIWGLCKVGMNKQLQAKTPEPRQDVQLQK